MLNIVLKIINGTFRDPFHEAHTLYYCKYYIYIYIYIYIKHISIPVLSTKLQNIIVIT